MSVVAISAILIGSIAAFKVGGFDRIEHFFHLSASASDFWFAIVAIVIFSVNLEWLPTCTGIFGTDNANIVLFIRPSVSYCRLCAALC